MCAKRALASSAALAASRGRMNTLGTESMAAMERISLEHLQHSTAPQGHRHQRCSSPSIRDFSCEGSRYQCLTGALVRSSTAHAPSATCITATCVWQDIACSMLYWLPAGSLQRHTILQGHMIAQAGYSPSQLNGTDLALNKAHAEQPATSKGRRVGVQGGKGQARAVPPELWRGHYHLGQLGVQRILRHDSTHLQEGSRSTRGHSATSWHVPCRPQLPDLLASDQAHRSLKLRE